MILAHILCMMQQTQLDCASHCATGAAAQQRSYTHALQLQDTRLLCRLRISSALRLQLQYCTPVLLAVSECSSTKPMYTLRMRQ
jgi:hypothetical protein